MAEFQEVCKQWRRMCDTTKCTDCKMNEFCDPQPPKEAKIVEEIIMAWAAEHPEPVYPSFAKYLEQFGIIIRCDGTLQGDPFRAHEPMDADIAQKLGIEPKEAVPWNAQK